MSLAENSGAVVERENLLRQVWGERAQSDEPLTRCIGELRRALGDARAEPDYIQTIPKRGYRLLQAVAPLARDAEEDGDEDVLKLTPLQRSLKLNTIKKMAAFAVILLGAALVGVFMERWQDGSGRVAERSIAVLPFVNLSSDKEQEYFSDGISEELLNLLARIPELRVISRTSAFSYKGKGIDIPTIAEQLNVAHVLEGSVRKAGNQVRISAQLIEAQSDTHLWSETYDRTLDDIFAIQDEIAATVVEQLKVTLLGDAPQVRPTNPEAYSLLLQARHFSRNVTAEGLEHANVLYEQALAIDPDYAPAWVGLAVNYNNLATNSYMPFDEGFRRAREAANRALAVDPDNPAAYAHLGWIAMWYDHDLAAAASHYERALSVDPSNFAIIANAALLLKGLGRLHEAVALVEYHTARDPVNPTAHYNLGLGYLSAGRWEESIAAQRTVLQLSPDYIGVHSFIGTALLMLDDTEAALEAMSHEPSEAYRWLGLVMANHALGRTDAADAVLIELIEKYEQNWAYNIAYVLAFRKDADRAFEWLDKAVEYGDPGLADIVAEVLFSHLHLDPRWTAFLERIGKAPAQLRAIKFDVAMPN